MTRLPKVRGGAGLPAAITLVAASWLAVFATKPAAGQSLSAGREYEPVVLEGTRLTDWDGVTDLTKIGLFRYNGSGFDPIPFQIDKRRKINLKHNINDPTNPGGNANVCEWGYFRELGVSPGSGDDNFASNTLQGTDEIVFLLNDAGSSQAPRTTWHSDPNVASSRYDIVLTDPRTGADRFVYAFLWDSGSPTISSTKYATWTDDILPDPLCINGAGSCGVAQGERTALPSALVTHRVHFQKNWVTDRFELNSGSGWLSDFIDRFVYNQGQQDEDSWSAQGTPLFLGVYNQAGGMPVRIVRAIQGAQSGRQTTKYEFVYPTAFVTRVNLRVHPLSEVKGRIRQDPTVSNFTPKPVIWTHTSYTQSPPVVRDTIDGNGPFSEQVDHLSAFPDWSEIVSIERGTYEHLFFEPRAMPASGKGYTYQDRQNNAHVGLFGRVFTGIGNTQDGAFNSDYEPCPGCAISDGGCGTSDPEGSSLNFARFEQTIFPQMSRPAPGDSTPVLGHQFQNNALDPMTVSTRKQNRYAPDPPPVSPCRPALNTVNPGHGPVDLTVNTSGCDVNAMYRLYRAPGSGSLVFLRDLGSATTFRDINVSPGVTYRYAASAYNEVNVEGQLSVESTITATDTTPPAIPVSIVGTPGDQRVTVTWQGNKERDIYGYDVYMSTSGGNYVKMNGTLLSASANAQWIQIGLTNGLNYCFKVTATDLAGNTSAQSAAGCATPTP